MSLSQELATDPLQLGYAARIQAGDHSGVVSLLNTADPTRLLPFERFITGRGVLASLGVQGALILDKLEAFGATQQQDAGREGVRLAVKWAMRFAQQEGDGVDLGHPNTRLLIQGCVLLGVLTQSECDALLDLALRPASRAEELLGRPVTLTEVSEVLINVG